MTNPLLHKAKLLLLALPSLLLLAAACTTPQVPVSITSFTTSKDIGETITLRMEGGSDNLWIDLNNSGTFERGEKLTHNDRWERQEFTIQSQEFTIYGDLTKLDCSRNELKSIDVSKLTKLEELDCSSNQLTNINISKLPKLKKLTCYDNQLKSLDVSKLTNLEWLNCYDNQLTNLNVRNLPKLGSLICSGNQLTSIDVSKLHKLEVLNCSSNQLTSIYIWQLPKLKEFKCYNNRIKLSEMTKIINALPVVDNDGYHGYHTFYPNNLCEDGKEQNETTVEQLEIARSKGWELKAPECE